MNNKEIVKQMIDFHKVSFENCFAMMLLIQGQAEKLLKTFIDKTPGISEESKNVVHQWSIAYKKSIDDLKKALDDGYAKIEEFINNNTANMFQDQSEKMFNSYLTVGRRRGRWPFATRPAAGRRPDGRRAGGRPATVMIGCRRTLRRFVRVTTTQPSAAPAAAYRAPLGAGPREIDTSALLLDRDKLDLGMARCDGRLADLWAVAGRGRSQ